MAESALLSVSRRLKSAALFNSSGQASERSFNEGKRIASESECVSPAEA